eukprot:CAMPEP_0197628940 /NCGR_PEP_ID=MMETSP1338-20131121/7017_1 /TAXON_ID=43686 ORGANISM="Pelagodinium beii, Strain RCC1491" /NCGR_SAMPLE_ID=MMETSP1338 /ASSEMBLY_ACC=CAM_ASM_000754 /LENGTH=295 /DNA_ID=CAMNT_0043199943 /DNA_START=57 /DNA_END=944 /DNA_ORIENTATION=+
MSQFVYMLPLLLSAVLVQAAVESEHDHTALEADQKSIIRKEVKASGGLSDDASSQIPVNYLQYKFTVQKTVGGHGPAALSRFVLLNSYGQELPLANNLAAEVYLLSSNGRKKSAADAIDVNIHTSVNVNFESDQSLVVLLKQPERVGGYYWITSTEDAKHDPVSWTLSGSNDGETWVELSRQENHPSPSTRGGIVGSFIMSKANFLSYETETKVVPCGKDSGKEEPAPKKSAAAPPPCPPPAAPASTVYQIVRPPPVTKYVYIDARKPCDIPPAPVKDPWASELGVDGEIAAEHR